MRPGGATASYQLQTRAGANLNVTVALTSKGPFGSINSPTLLLINYRRD